MLAAAAVAALLLLPRATAPVNAAAAQNPVQIENSKPGTSDWRLVTSGYASGAIEGYPSLTSVNRGGQIKFFVNTSDPTYTLEIFRMGYYQGLGARRMTAPVTLTGVKQTIPSPDPTTGLIECTWINPYVLNIPASADPTDWMSGFYYVKLTGSSGKQQFIHFVVRDDSRSSDLLLAEGITTAQAYNVWGGKSLYGTIANRSDTANAAQKVSFDRPFYGDESYGAGNFSDRNDYKVYEWGMVRFLEANGYDVTYATNLDVDRDANLLLTHKAFISAGHDEYWSWTMRDNVERARDMGVSLGFFSANTSYWQVRFEPSVATGAPSRVMVGYKATCSQDPITPINRRTCRFRDAPVNRSEDRMVGVMYITQGRMPFVVEDASHWLFTGTGLHNGDALLNPDGTPFIGYEVDAVGANSPANLERAGHSPVKPSRANFADTTAYRAASGATVFASGSILWTYDVPQIVQITRNVLARLISNALPEAPPARPQLPAPLQAVDIGDVGRAGFVSAAAADAFTLNGAGQDAAGSRDALYYAYEPLGGDGTIVTRVTAVQEGWDNRAGVMIRESLAADARFVAIVSRPSDSRFKNGSGINEGVELRVRSTPGAKPQTIAMQDLPLPNWIKLTRSGTTFQAFYSSDGSAWTLLGSTTAAMGAQVDAGLSVASAQHAVWVTASFDHVSFAGDAAGTTRLRLEAPSTGATLPGSFTAKGWALDPGAAGGTGVDAVHFYAYPNYGSGAAPTFLGAASYGQARPDVADEFGAQFTNAGFQLAVQGLAAGRYRLVAYAHNTATNTFNASAIADVTVAAFRAVAIDTPAPSATVTSAFEVGGWALDNMAPSGTGIDAVHFYASPRDGADPGVFLGTASLGWTRNDVAAAYGTQFAPSGYHFTVTGMAPGAYLLLVYAHSTVTHDFSIVQTRHITVSATTLMSIDTPSPESTIAGRAFSVSGWAIDRSAPSGTGIDTLHVYAYPSPGSGQAAIFLGIATTGIARSDIGSMYGSRYLNSGYGLNVNADALGLAPGVYDIVVWAHSAATGAFTTSAVVRVRLP